MILDETVFLGISYTLEDGSEIFVSSSLIESLKTPVAW